MTRRRTERGNILFYIFLIMFLMGVLIVTFTQGPSKHAQTRQLDEMVSFLTNDIQVIENAINECALTYPDAVDVNTDGAINSTDNPNPPFPLYSDLSSGAAGNVVGTIKCPGAPTAVQAVFSNKAGNTLKLLGQSPYTAMYFNDSTEGVMLRITRTTPNATWLSAISRINTKFSTCKAASTGYIAAPCDNGCFYYWLLRRSTSVTEVEVGCP